MILMIVVLTLYVASMLLQYLLKPPVFIMIGLFVDFRVMVAFNV